MRKFVKRKTTLILSVDKQEPCQNDWKSTCQCPR